MSQQLPGELFEKLKSMVGLCDQDIQNLELLRPIVEKHGPEITDRFYATLATLPETARFIEGRVDALKQTHRQWMRSMVTGPYDYSYLESRWRVGMAHVRIGLDPYWVECIMSFVRTAMCEAIGQEVESTKSCANLCATFVKLCDLDLMVVNLSYAEVRLERLTSFTGMKRTLIENIIRLPRK